jgi:hypothetical protein
VSGQTKYSSLPAQGSYSTKVIEPIRGRHLTDEILLGSVRNSVAHRTFESSAARAADAVPLGETNIVLNSVIASLSATETRNSADDRQDRCFDFH